MNYNGRESDNLQEALDHGPLRCNIINPSSLTAKCQDSIESSLSRIHWTRLKTRGGPYKGRLKSSL